MFRSACVALLVLSGGSAALAQSGPTAAPVCDPLPTATLAPLAASPAFTPRPDAVAPPPATASAPLSVESFTELADIFGNSGETEWMERSLAPYVAVARKSNGTLLQPLVQEAAFAETSPAFLFGNDFLVLPAADAARRVSVTFPKGVWINYWTGTQLLGGGVEPVQLAAGDLPMWVRGGAVIPRRTAGVKGLLEQQLVGSADTCGELCLFDVLPAFTGNQPVVTTDADGRTLTRNAEVLRVDGPATRAFIRWRYTLVQNVLVNGVPVKVQRSPEGDYIVLEHVGQTEVEWTIRNHRTPLRRTQLVATR